MTCVWRVTIKRVNSEIQEWTSRKPDSEIVNFLRHEQVVFLFRFPKQTPRTVRCQSLMKLLSIFESRDVITGFRVSSVSFTKKHKRLVCVVYVC